ncbi:MAG: hypothetical protein QW692_02055 [Nitrososphaerota archaeon]
MKHEITLRGFAAKCYEFKPDMHQQPQLASIIIIPIKVVEDSEQGSMRISWACNRGKNCYNTSCSYARGGAHVV